VGIEKFKYLRKVGRSKNTKQDERTRPLPHRGPTIAVKKVEDKINDGKDDKELSGATCTGE
jgi:hypothetical protein